MSLILRMKFWFAMGFVGLAALLIFAVGAVPQRIKSIRGFSDLRRRYVELDKLKSGPLNQQWAARQEELEKGYQEQIQEVQEELVKRDEWLEQCFDDDEMGTKGPLQGGRWMSVYKKKADELLQELKNSVTRVTPSNPLVFREFGPKWPKGEEMREAEKRYWVQKAIVEALAGVNTAQMIVPILDSFAFSAKPERFMHPSHKDSFKAIPFQLTVVMEFKNVPVFLEYFINSPLKPEVTSIALSRGGAAGTTTPSAAPSWSPQRMTPPAEVAQLQLVNPLKVVINAYIPDYVQPGKGQPPVASVPAAPAVGRALPTAAPPVPKAGAPAERKSARANVEALEEDIRRGK